MFRSCSIPVGPLHVMNHVRLVTLHTVTDWCRFHGTPYNQTYGPTSSLATLGTRWKAYFHGASSLPGPRLFVSVRTTRSLLDSPALKSVAAVQRLSFSVKSGGLQ